MSERGFKEIALCSSEPDFTLGAPLRDELTCDGYRRVPWVSVRWTRDLNVSWIGGEAVWTNANLFHFGSMGVEKDLDFWIVIVDAYERILCAFPKKTRLVVPWISYMTVTMPVGNMRLVQHEYDRIRNADKGVRPLLRLVK